MTGECLRTIPAGYGYRYGQLVAAEDWPGTWDWVTETGPDGVTVYRPVLVDGGGP